MIARRERRSILRWVHIGTAGFLAVYLYSPMHADPFWTACARLGLIPALAVSGGWLWQQGYLARLFGTGEG